MDRGYIDIPLIKYLYEQSIYVLLRLPNKMKMVKDLKLNRSKIIDLVISRNILTNIKFKLFI